MYDYGLGHPWLNPEGTFKVFCKADEGLCLAVRGGSLVLAAADPADEHQHWFKDVRFSLRIKDEEGKPVFSLINKATGLAIRHSLGPYHPVCNFPSICSPLPPWVGFLENADWDLG
jgi:hypothetical protein